MEKLRLLQGKICMILSLLFLTALPSFAQDDNGGESGEGGNEGTQTENPSTGPALDPTRPVWQQVVPSGDNYLTARRALIGFGCEVNSIVNSVGVGAWNQSLSDLTQNTDQAASFTGIASVSVTADAIVSVRDMKNYYTGMKAGFALSAASGSSVLTLDVIKAWAIGFYRDGELIQTVPVQAGQDDTGLLNLKLITLAGSKDVDMEVSVDAPTGVIFDEIMLMPSAGISLSVVNDLKVKYAFVGTSPDYLIGPLGAAAFHAAHPGSPVIANITSDVTMSAFDDKVVDDDPATGAACTSVLSIGEKYHSTVTAEVAPMTAEEAASIAPEYKVGAYTVEYGHKIQGDAADVGYEKDSESTYTQVCSYPRGVKVTFNMEQADVLSLKTGAWVKLTLKQRKLTRVTDVITAVTHNHVKYEYDYSELVVQNVSIDAKVLALGLAKGKQVSYTITADSPFDVAEITLGTALDVSVGGTTFYDVVIQDPVTSEEHCDLKLTSVQKPCDNDYRVYSTSETINAGLTWVCVEAPEGVAKSSVTVGGNGIISGLTLPGRYTFEATDAHGCKEQVSVLYGSLASEALNKREALVNVAGEPEKYTLTTDGEGSFALQLGAYTLSDPENILTETTDDYAQYSFDGILTLVQNKLIAGVKTKNGSSIIDEANPKQGRVGFVVELVSQVNVKLLNVFRIKGYSAGAEVLNAAVSEWEAITADVIGDRTFKKVRLSVPLSKMENVSSLDELQLWSTGVGEVTLPGLYGMNIYYAFYDDEDIPFEHRAMEIVSYKTGASLKGMSMDNDNKEGSAVAAAKVDKDLSLIIDDDKDFSTYAIIQNTVSVGSGKTIVVNMGRTYSDKYQVGVVMKAPTDLADVDVASWITLETFKNGVTTGNKNSSWDLIQADVIGGQQVILFALDAKAGADFDELHITMANIAGVLTTSNICGVFVRQDTDLDGVPDIIDENNMCGDIVLSEDVDVTDDSKDTNINIKGKNIGQARLILKRTIARSEKTGGKDNVWNSIVLPVSLNGVQLRNAFGNYVRIAEAVGFDEDTENTIKFELKNIPANDYNTVLEAGKFYIIRTLRAPQVAENKSVDVDDKTHPGVTSVSGEAYIIKDVNYDASNESKYYGSNYSVSSDVLDSPEKEKYGSICYYGSFGMTSVPARSYVLGSGEQGTGLFHTKTPRPMKGFRFWFEDVVAGDGNGAAVPRSFSVTDSEGGTTYIYNVLEDGRQIEADANVYDVSGRVIGNSNDFGSAKPGMYIINGKKMFVK